ncbi:MAG TPA: response regulator [Blastocatellia bacterium]|nr:response regulator [Blastocatellia bacterium]
MSNESTKEGLLVEDGSVAIKQTDNQPSQSRTEGQSQAVADLVWHDLKLQTLDRVNLILASTVDTEVALQEAVRFFQQVFGHRGCAVYLADDRQESLTLIAASGEVTGGRQSQALTGPSAPEVAQYSTPLWRGDEIIGLLRIDGGTRGEFRDHELEAIGIFARQASVALRQVVVTREARTARKRFLDFYASAQDGYCSFLSDGAILEINETQLGWLGYRREEVIGRWTLPDLLIASGSAAFPEFVARLQAEGRATLETEQICRDGRTIPVLIHARADFSEDGKFVQAHATVRDISSEKQLLEQLAQVQKRDSLSHLAGVLAHEFNNLLTGIIGFNALARRQIGEQHRASRSLMEIERAAKGAVSLVTQLIAFGRSQLSRPEPTDLNLLVRDAVRFLESALPDTVSITCLPGDSAGTINADQELIQQVVLSLCASANRTDERRELLIETGHTVLDEQFVLKHPGARPGSWHFIRITDTGSQPDEEMLQRLSDQFFNVALCQDSQSLRLALAQQIIRNHDGYITARSESGRGVVFTIFLPAVRALIRTASEAAAGTRGGGETILVVDDEPMVSRLVREMLSSYGYNILTASNGREALSLYRERGAEIALVITDVVMPEMQGPELCREIQKLRPDARLLLTSGYSTSEELQRLIAEGVSWIQKPYQGDDLAYKVRRVLDEESLTDQGMKSSERQYATVYSE